MILNLSSKDFFYIICIKYSLLKIEGSVFIMYVLDMLW